MAKGVVTEYTGWTRKDVRTGFAAACIAGFFMTCTVAPADNLRTRLMNQPTNAKIYDGFSDCLVKTVKSDGVLSLWRGFIPLWARFAPQATLQLLTIEFLYGLGGFKAI
jgi:Mitochondrial carrier protein